MSRKPVLTTTTTIVPTPRPVSVATEEKKESKEPLGWSDDDEIVEKSPLVPTTGFSICAFSGASKGDLASILRLKPTVRGGAKAWCIPIAYAANMTTSGSGFINATLPVATVAATSYFTSLATLFDEFYVERMDVMFQPQTRYQSLPSTTSTEYHGTPLGVASMFEDTTVYTNINQMASNPTFQFSHSSSPFSYSWVNNVARSKAMSSEPTSTQAALGWVRTNATPAQYYGGLVQFIGSATYAMHASINAGIIAVRYKVWFRAKS